MRGSTIAALIVVLVMASPTIPSVGSSRAAAAGNAPMAGPFANEPVWTDPLDDLSHVYIPSGGLVGIEVSGGDAHLKPGSSEGWLASSVITCPPGYRYDLVYLQVDMPGASQVQVSILNASKDTTEVGFANETVPQHVKVASLDHSVIDIPPSGYPKIRIQVNLLASGTDRPRLLAWTMYYVGLEEWRDDFLGKGRMQQAKRVNVSGSAVELNLAMRNTYTLGWADYSAYPAILANQVDTSNQYAFYPNPGHTAYGGRTTIAADVTFGSVVDDLDQDGNPDLFVANYRSGTDYTRDSLILWGDGTGTWSLAGATAIATDNGRRPQVGDVNGDGRLDLLVCSGASTTAYVAVYLNPGNRSWSPTAAISLPASNLNNVAAGDLDGDGFDDVVLAENYAWSGSSYSRAYMGGPSGPDTTADVHFKTGVCYDVELQDLNKDGYPDVAFADTLQVAGQDRAHVFVSSAGAFDGNVSTYQLDVPTSGETMSVDSGDINGDGWTDLAFGRRGGGGSNRIYVFWGSSSGYSNGARADPVVTSSMNDVVVIDVDKDGFADVISASRYANRIDVYKGAAGGIDGTADISLNSAAANALSVGVGREHPSQLWGSFTTVSIQRPLEDRWDILVLEGDFPPGTDATVTVLDNDMAPVLGFSNLKGPDVDLRGVSNPEIHLQVTLRSSDLTRTPHVTRLLVKWMGANVWRDEFYGKAKVDALLGMDVTGGQLVGAPVAAGAPEIVFANGRTASTYGVDSYVYRDAGGLDYLSQPPIKVTPPYGATAVAAGDLNGDGLADLVFAVPRVGDTDFSADSALFYGTPVGWRSEPDLKFKTTGARDLVLRDLNGDGRLDVVFAQEQDGNTYRINSSLYWGTAAGFNATPDAEFETSGASGVEAADLNGDGRLDLAFACYRDAASTATDSMVFLQGADGFCGTLPSYRLPTNGARAVAAGDLDRDGRMDLAFANSFAGGSTEIGSYVYWGKSGGGFEAAPLALPTVGADDVKVADLNGDPDPDLVFANARDNAGHYGVDSYVYLNHGAGAFGPDPDARLPTRGASAVAVADLDGLGWKDLVFACQFDGTSYDVPSRVYLGGAGGWGPSPDIALPTRGASDVIVARVLKQDGGGYLSKAISPEKPSDAGTFHTFRYTAHLGAGQGGTLSIIDATTWQVLAQTTLQDGTNELSLAGLFALREHPALRVLVSGTGLDHGGTFSLDDLWLNWTTRVRQAPRVVDLVASPASILRTRTGELAVNVTDEYDYPQELKVTVEHALNGTVTWGRSMIGTLSYTAGAWRARLAPRIDLPAGAYDLRVNVTDSDGQWSGWVVFGRAVVVLNNRPTAPEIRIDPPNPVSTSTLQVIITVSSTDIESGALTYHYRWFKDGVPQVNLTSDTVLWVYLRKGENWSVDVRAWDGGDEGPDATAWTIVRNAGPIVKRPLPNPAIAEDSVDDKWIDLSTAFEDPDGDPLTLSVSPAPHNISVTIDHATGKVTLRPLADWNGQEAITFVASDGEMQASQTVLVTVTPVDDPPAFTTINGQPITTDPVTLTVKQGQLLVIDVGYTDVEADALVFSVNTTAVQVDESTGQIQFQPGNDVVGTLRFALTVLERSNPAVRTLLNFTITVENVNDPPSVPRISNPKAGSSFKANVTFSLIGIADDPDTKYGQVLNYTWTANGTVVGYGSSKSVSFPKAGTYNITLTVSDGEFQRSASVTVTIEPVEIVTPPPVNPDEHKQAPPPYALIAGIIVVVCVAVLVAFMVLTRRKAEEVEAKDEVEEKREAFKQMHAEVKATADQMEAELAASQAAGVPTGKPGEVTVEARAPGGEAAMATPEGMEDRMLTMRPQETEAASKETMALFKDMARGSAAAAATQDQGQMREDNLKRKYSTAIGRLPYGIPSPELKDMDWNVLAAALATGEKQTLPDGREVTRVEGRWYYSDPGDSSSFLKEHGAKPKAEGPRAGAAKAAPSLSRAEMLAKLEERLIMGKISEETYKDLKRKYAALPEEGGNARSGSDEWEEAGKGK